jgi:hypothetical protein
MAPRSGMDKKSGSVIRDKRPRSATLFYMIFTENQLIGAFKHLSKVTIELTLNQNKDNCIFMLNSLKTKKF